MLSPRIIFLILAAITLSLILFLHSSINNIHTIESVTLYLPVEMSDSDLISINIALLPPPTPHPLQEYAKQLNFKLYTEASTTSPINCFEFDDSHFAHVTLVQGCVKKNQLQEIFSQIEQLIKDGQFDSELKLSTAALASGPPKPSMSPSIAIPPTKSLTHLHNTLLSLLHPYRHTPVPTSSFYVKDNDATVDQTIGESTTNWVTTFETNAARENYFPHITLGVGKQEVVESMMKEENKKNINSFDWTADRIYVFQLGNHGTCRKKLKEISLNPNSYV